jgi:ParB-like chromosome segregation protein Spo0J
VILAQDWQQALANKSHVSPAALAQHLGLSRVRVTQVLRLLRLTPKVRKTIAALGDPLPIPVVTERRLRPMINLSAHEQLQEIQAMIAKGCRAFVC